MQHPPINANKGFNRLKKGAQRLINANRMLKDKRSQKFHVGEAPGIDFSRTPNSLFAHLNETLRCDVTVNVIDYGPNDAMVHPAFTNCAVEDFFNQPRPPLPVRWVNVVGIDFEVVRSLSQKFGLHPLSVEDLMHYPQRIKADFYERHVFVSTQLVALEELAQPASLSSSSNAAATLHDLPGGTSPQDNSIFHTPIGRGLLETIKRPKRASRHFDLKSERSATTGELRLRRVFAEQVFIFLFKDGTVISFFQQEGSLVTYPITTRLQTPQTLVRDSDASFLLFCLLDAIVDHALPIVDAYSESIYKIESLVLTKAKAQYTMELHLLSAELKLLKRTFMPTLHLVQALKRSTTEFLSKLTLEYMNDITDHIMSSVENLELLSTQSKDLVDLVCFFSLF